MMPALFVAQSLASGNTQHPGATGEGDGHLRELSRKSATRVMQYYVDGEGELLPD